MRCSLRHWHQVHVVPCESAVFFILTAPTTANQIVMGVSVLTRISHEEHVQVFTAKVVLSAVVLPGQGYGPFTQNSKRQGRRSTFSLKFTWIECFQWKRHQPIDTRSSGQGAAIWRWSRQLLCHRSIEIQSKKRASICDDLRAGRDPPGPRGWGFASNKGASK